MTQVIIGIKKINLAPGVMMSRINREVHLNFFATSSYVWPSLQILLRQSTELVAAVEPRQGYGGCNDNHSGLTIGWGGVLGLISSHMGRKITTTLFPHGGDSKWRTSGASEKNRSYLISENGKRSISGYTSHEYHHCTASSLLGMRLNMQYQGT